MSNLQVTQKTNLVPKTFDEAFKVADRICKTNFVPAHYRNKPHEACAAVMLGAEVGVSPLVALKNIAVINGMPSIWGDLFLGLIQSHPKYEYIDEYFENTKEGITAVCKIKRKGSPEHVATFSETDAKTAGLWGKNVWKSYPKRMLQMRARGFAGRNQFSDALGGMVIHEEAQDYQYINVTPKKPDDTKPIEGIVVEADLTESEKLFIKGEEMIKSAKTSESLISMANDLREMNMDEATKEMLLPLYNQKLEALKKIEQN